MDMEFGNLAQLGSFVVSLITLSFVVVTYRSKAANDRVNKLAEKIETLEDGVARLEGSVKHLPDQAAIHRIEMALTEMQGDLKVGAEKMKGLSAISERLQTFLERQSDAKPARRRT